MNPKTIAIIAAALAPLMAASHAAAQSAFDGKSPSNMLAEKHQNAIGGKTVNPGLVQKIACPDLAVVMAEKRRGSTIYVVYGVRNAGTADFVTGPNQQMLSVKTPAGERTFPFGNLRVGAVKRWKIGRAHV